MRKEQNHSNVATQSYRVFVLDSQLPKFLKKGGWRFYYHEQTTKEYY